MKINQQPFHDFFYCGEDGEFHKGNWAYSYYGRFFYSYDTAIGARLVDKYGHDVLFLADLYFSNTTSSHVSVLRNACPFAEDQIIYVPFRAHDNFLDQDECVQLILNRLVQAFQERDVSALRYVVNRKQFMMQYRAFRFILDRFNVKRPAENILNLVDELFNVVESADNRKKLKEQISGLAAKKEVAEKRKRAAERRKHAQVLKKYSDFSYLDKIRHAYFDKDRNRYEELKNALNPYFELAFVAPSPYKSDEVFTTLGVSLSYDIVIPLLKAWKKGRIKEGMHIGPYTLKELHKEYACIGCHKIPMENIEALYQELVEQPQKSQEKIS